MAEQKIQITRLRITNYRGLAKLDVPVGPGGAIFSGTNGEGKTTAIESINAALEGVGIGPEAIRVGSDKSEILIDLDKVEGLRRTSLEVKRTIAKSGPKIAVTGSDGVPLPKPKEQLAALFGGRALDPLEFLMADAKEQRRIVLSANPVQVTAADLLKWTEEERDWNTAGHGQEVLARVRQMYFDMRTKAGQTADQAKATASVVEDQVAKLRVENPVNISVAAASTQVSAAEREIAILHDRRKKSAERVAASAETRAKVAALRAKAEDMMSNPDAVAPEASEVERLMAERNMAYDAWQTAQRAFDTAENAFNQANAKVKAAASLEREATAAITQANELEAAIVDGTGDDTETMATAEAAKVAAEEQYARAKATEAWRASQLELKVCLEHKAKADAEWGRLDAIVKRLSIEAPAEIASRADLIAGLEVTEGAILLDGKDISLLCGSEKMQFAITLAKRMAGKAKILTVDGLEQIAPAKQAEFVKMCLEGGWALFATVVADGSLQVIDAYTFASA